jgi:hypothetical protein
MSKKHRAKIGGLALIFDVQPCELRSLNLDDSISVSSRSILSSLGRGRRFLAPQIDSGFGTPQFLRHSGYRMRNGGKVGFDGIDARAGDRAAGLEGSDGDTPVSVKIVAARNW